MNDYFDVWETLYEHDFNKDKFLYHYTNVYKAFKILDGEKLKFSKLSFVNDTLEAKPKVFFDKQGSDRNLKIFEENFRKVNNECLQLLCMSQDEKLTLSARNDRELYSDYSGRGFALPRMWAQYANNNNGICFIFDKNKLISSVEETVGAGIIRTGEVDYVSRFESKDFKMDDIIAYVNRVVNKKGSARDVFDYNFLKTYKSFVDCNYFSKLDDWRGEKEFRFLAYGRDDYYIPCIDALVGIVVGENIDDCDVKIINFLNNKKCEIMRISFTSNGCMLKNIYERKGELQ